ncbi:N-acetyllactosaminide beta-1,3-N-acetylglucosaminyltransferase 2 [Colossoma macropomum]|uniref:N-acetyllactosaminide beta-1,3-N-acetylglucosaminyltransferase 2 n=1 Tax=Colossoma macropomum TaxID=42526 RepID=UPI0018651A61|nr:N-acetyllactosaminide beta-1,3-N-acetylglucosaminyltransferase 2 [Colossoma macropomum]
MARCRCSGRALCLCLLPFLMMSHLLVYIMVSIFVAISYTPEPQLPRHFVAPGASSNSGALAPHPIATFWNLRLVEGALWNRLQHLQDREHNPILRGNSTGDRGTSTDPNYMHETEADGSPSCSPDHLWASQLPDFNTMPEQMQDFVLSMHCRRYSLLIDQPGLCTEQDAETETPMLLMAIKSQVGHFENRQAIRETWGRSGWVKEEAGGKRWQVRTIFLLGRQDGTTGPHPDLAALLQLESDHHKDILQWDFRDTFFNLTLKDVLFWDWLSMHCPHAHFIFKGDDDVFVRTGTLLDYLNEHKAPSQGSNNRSKGKEDFLVGDVITNAWPSRQANTKYYIPESFYKGAYPTYAGGGGVVYSGALALRLQVVSRWVSLFPIDDVYLGMCLHRLGISPLHHPGFLTFDLPEAEREKPCAYRRVLLVHKRSPKEMLTLWRELKAPLPEC